MSEKTTKPKAAPTLSPEVAALSAAITPHLLIKDGAVGEKEPGTAYIATLPDTIPAEMARMVHHHDSNFFPAAAHAMVGVAVGIAVAEDGTKTTVEGKIDALGHPVEISLNPEVRRFDVSSGQHVNRSQLIANFSHPTSRKDWAAINHQVNAMVNERLASLNDKK